jgi:hypothetical protein
MNKIFLSLAVLALIMFIGCSDPWDDVTKLNDNVSQNSIASEVAETPDFSMFWELMKQTGVDKKLDSSAVYTLFVPTNSVMQAAENLTFESDAEKLRFVLNHVTWGRISSRSGSTADSLYMLSGKRLKYSASLGSIDGIGIHVNQEKAMRNGIVQIVDGVIKPRFSIWDWVLYKAPENRFIKYLKSLDYWYFDPIASGYLGSDDRGRPIYRDSVVVLRNSFLQQVADLQHEDSLFTLLVPSDEVFQAMFNKFERYYRAEDRSSNPVPTVKDSVNIWMNVAKDLVFGKAYSGASLPDTLLSFYGVKVPFVSSSVTDVYTASNGTAYLVSDCSIETKHKILPIIIDAERSLYSPTAIGARGLYVRERKNALSGFDVIVDNHERNGVSAGMVLRGGSVSSMRYRVKMRAINDFAKSTFWPDTNVVLRQMVGTVTVIRDKETGLFKDISPNTNYLNSSSTYGNADVVYDPEVPSSYYVPVTKKAYSSVEQAMNDEVDLGYYEFKYVERAFFRILPLGTQMAVTADYIRLVPILEAD